MKVVIVMNPDPNSWVRPRVVEQNLFHPRVGEENTDQFPCRFLVVFVIVPGDWKLKAVFAKRTHVDLKAVNMRRVFVFRSVSLADITDPELATVDRCPLPFDPQEHCHHRRMGVLKLPSARGSVHIVARFFGSLREHEVGACVLRLKLR